MAKNFIKLYMKSTDEIQKNWSQIHNIDLKNPKFKFGKVFKMWANKKLNKLSVDTQTVSHAIWRYVYILL